MRATTHLALAGLTGVVGAGFGAGPDLSAGVALTLGSLLPDVDTPHSTAGRVVPPLARSLERRFGHRTITHSLLGMIGIAVLLSPLLLIHRPLWSWLLIGYASHLLIDTANVSGVPLFWPARLQVWLVYNRAWRVPYGSGRESVWLACIVVMGLVLAPISLTGFTPWFHRTLGTPYGAVADYLRWKDGREVWAHVRGTNLMTGERIDRSFRIVGALNSEMLLLEDEQGRAFSAGLGQQASITTERVAVRPGNEIDVATYQLDLAEASLGSLEFDPRAGRVFLTGLLLLDEAPTLTHTAGQYARAEASGRQLELRAATPAELAGLAHYRVEAGSVVIRIEGQADSTLQPPKISVVVRREKVSIMVTNLPTLDALLVGEGSILVEGTLIANYPDDGRLTEARAAVEQAETRLSSLQEQRRLEELKLETDRTQAGVSIERARQDLERERYLVTNGAAPASHLRQVETELRLLEGALEQLEVTRMEQASRWAGAEEAAQHVLDERRRAVEREIDLLVVHSPLAGEVIDVDIVHVDGGGIDVELSVAQWK